MVFNTPKSPQRDTRYQVPPVCSWAINVEAHAAHCRMTNTIIVKKNGINAWSDHQSKIMFAVSCDGFQLVVNMCVSVLNAC